MDKDNVEIGDGRQIAISVNGSSIRDFQNTSQPNKYWYEHLLLGIEFSFFLNDKK